ncbi:uncharacterized protein LOC62_05G007198 [Vanrija pseudolonga]|uniref:Uncharacterized protein n=1 Tax=Vanrija pseudolonga TaxID=143232 RepID=A0AAF0YHH3_9TREE|nr:hypothetical protein LOC62_05G007198 [Vanrija pseudolonga]
MRTMIISIIDEVTKHHDFVSYTHLVNQHIALGGLGVPLAPDVGVELARLGNRIQTCDGTSAEVKEEAASWIRRVFAMHDGGRGQRVMTQGCYPDLQLSSSSRTSSASAPSSHALAIRPDPALAALAAAFAAQRADDVAQRAENARLLRALVERVERLQNSLDAFAAA